MSAWLSHHNTDKEQQLLWLSGPRWKVTGPTKQNYCFSLKFSYSWQHCFSIWGIPHKTWKVQIYKTMRKSHKRSVSVNLRFMQKYINIYIGRFIMFSVITNIYNKKAHRTYLNGIVHSHRKTEKAFFWQLVMFDMCTMGDTAHIDTIFKFNMLMRVWQELEHCIDVCCVTCGAHIKHL